MAPRYSDIAFATPKFAEKNSLLFNCYSLQGSTVLPVSDRQFGYGLNALKDIHTAFFC